MSAKQLNDYLGVIRPRIFECKEELEKERKLVTAGAIKRKLHYEEEFNVSKKYLVPTC